MGETVYTVRIRSISPTTNNTPLYMTHGFGGTSLFYYDIAAILRRHSEIILFDDSDFLTRLTSRYLTHRPL
jgi:hypothetical protein